MDVLRPAVHSHGVVAVADGLEDGALGIELLALLIVVRDLHVRRRAEPRRSRARARPSAYEAAWSCRSRSARSSRRDRRASRETTRPRTIGPAAERLADVLGLEHHLAGPVCRPRPAAGLCRSGSRRAARSLRMAISARTRPSSRVRRALMPWRSHASSCASRLSNFSCWTASFGEPRFLLSKERRRSRPARTSVGRDRARRCGSRRAAETRGRA